MSYDGGGVGGSIVEVDVFESLLAIPPAADVCRQENLPVDAILSVVIVRASCEFIPDDRITPFSIDIDYPLMEGPHAASINGEVRATVKDLLTKFLDSALHNSAYLVDVGLPYEAPFRLTGDVTLANERLYSVELPLWYYVPTAAHGDNAVRNFTFDLETGERVLLADLFLPDSDWTTTLEASLEVALRESKTAGTIQHLCTLGSGPWEYEDSVYADTFNVTEDALRIYHWLGPYACRVEPFDIPYADLVDVLDPDGPLQPCEVAQGAALVATCGPSGFSEAVFDVENATFDVEVRGDGCYDPMTFSDGEWIAPGSDDYFLSEKAWVTEFAVVELVEESPGPEVVADLVCTPGGTMRTRAVVVFAGNSSEATQLGRSLKGSVEWVAEEFGSSVVVRYAPWLSHDLHCCPSQYELIWYEWHDGDWVETDFEVWRKDPDAERLGRS